MKILRMSMFETDGAIPVPIRPYEMDMRSKGTLVEDLVEATDFGRSIDNVRMSKIASGLLVPSTRSIHTEIPNGWGERRIMFAMALQVNENAYMEDIRYITGYTDHNDISALDGNVKFANDMRLYFNSIAKIQLSEVAVRGGRGVQPTVKENNLMLLRSSVSMDRGTGGRRHNKPSLMRPYDVFARAGSNTVVNKLHRNLADSSNINIVTGTFGTETALSSRRNNNSANYLSQALSGYMGARAASHDSASNSGMMGDDEVNHNSNTSARLQESQIQDDVMFDEMARFSEIAQQGYITWGELLRMCPEFDEDRELPYVTWDSRIKSASRKYRDADTTNRDYVSGLADYQSSASFTESTTESLAALMIAQALPEILINAVYSKLDGLVIDTHPALHEPDIYMGLPHPFFDKVPVSYGARYLEDQLRHVVLPNISRNGAVHVQAHINANIDQDIEIWIQIDGGPEEYFIYPAWGEHALPPIMTDDVKDVHQLATSIANVADDLAVACESGLMRTMPRGTSGEEIFTGRPTRSTERSTGRDTDRNNPTRRDNTRSGGLTGLFS